MQRRVAPSESEMWAGSARLPNRWVTVGIVLASTFAAAWLTWRAFAATSSTVGGIERSHQALLVSIIAGLLTGMLALLLRRKRSRRAGIILTAFLAVGIGAGFVFGRWFAAAVTLCVDGTGVRTGCGTPWFGTFMKPKDAGGAYAGLGAVIALCVGLLTLALASALKHRKATKPAPSG